MTEETCNGAAENTKPDSMAPALISAPEPVVVDGLTVVEPKNKKKKKKPDIVYEAKDIKLGRPPTSWNEKEHAYIDEQMAQYLDILKTNPSTRKFVEEAITADIEMQRHDRMVERQRRQWPKLLDDEQTAWVLKQDKHRSGLMKRYTDALEAIGAMPKSNVDESLKDESLSDVHVRYANEIALRKTKGQRVGQISREAHQLATSEGLDVNRYGCADVIDDSERDQALKAVIK